MPQAAQASRPRIRLSSKQLAVYAAVIAAWIGYLVLTFLQRPNASANPYHFTDAQRIAIQLTIAVPYLFIWLAAFHGALQIKSYQTSLAEGTHRAAFRKLAAGLAWLAVGLLVTTFVSSIRNLPTAGSAYPALTVLLNHLYVLFPLVGFFCLAMGARGLARESGLRLTVGVFATAALTCLIVGGVQAYLIFSDAGRRTPSPLTGHATFYVPDVMLVTDYVIPTAISVAMAVFAAYGLQGFLRKSAAVIYEKSLPPLIGGLLMIMASTVILQLLLSLGQGRLLGLGLGAILAIVYAFLLIQGVGYVLVARGSGRLARLQATIAKYQADTP